MESRERDFFGFDTDLIQAPVSPKAAEAPMEVSFDIEDLVPPAPSPQASFIVPEPAVIGYAAPEPSVPDAEIPSFAEVPAASTDLPGIEEVSFQMEDLPPLGEQPVFDEVQFSLDATLMEPAPGPSPVPPPPAAPVRVPPPEAPRPAPVTPPTPTREAPPMASAAGPVTPPASLDAAAAIDPAVRKIIEDKVEKIVWEVVPEMAEVFIREAIEKIKRGA